MKLLGKIALILLAAVLVAGATLALTNRGALDSLTGGGPSLEGGERREMGDGDFAPGQRPERGEGRGRDGDQSLWGGLMGIARNLGVIAAIVAGVWLITWAGGRFAARRKVEQAGKEKMPDEMILSDQ